MTKKKQWKQKSTHLVRDEEASPKREQEKESEEAAYSAAEQSQEQEEEETEIVNGTETTRSLSLTPREYKALVDTSAQCTLIPSDYKGAESICVSGVTGGSQELSVLEAETALEQGEAPEHLQNIDDIIVWGNTAEAVFEKGKKIVQIFLKAGFAIKQSKVKGPAQEIQFLGIKWQDGRRQIPMDVITKITATSPPTSKKETQAFLGVVGFWRMHIPNYSLIISPLYQVTQKKNDFEWGPEQQQAVEQIRWEIVCAVALGPSLDRTRCEKHALHLRDNRPTWSF
ncbi:hypothetical protein QYF61_011172 [Mycteria americana]|uniref:Reverse transcriptase/retrotransposon-derived protein RNase H-like domain-containing protein n=1 Tax=Mycteria americana TaxID=33587 RepID=A0AAN7NTI4_MYCAM|nr:hypothetical protein QYF61_011172 [Mycteria americana]